VREGRLCVHWSGRDFLGALKSRGFSRGWGGPRNGRKLPSFLEGLPFFWPRPMLESRVRPGMVLVWWESQEIDLRRNAL